MKPAQRIGLGTAQFGLDYGITNRRGRVPEPEAGAILELAADAGIDLVDTAFLYGESEAVLGRSLAPDAPFRIVTKSDKLGPDGSGEALRAAFGQSLRRLGRAQVHGLLFHDAADLLGPAGETLWRCAEALQREGKVEKIGVSVYEGAELDAALDRYPLDLVQLPWNPVDSRLEVGGQLRRLQERGVEVHARSLFLQGLLLEKVERIPARYGPVAAAVAELDAAAREAGLTRLEAILAAAFARTEIDHFICGVTNRRELHVILLAAQKAKAIEGARCFPQFRDLDPRYLNPARWADLR